MAEMQILIAEVREMQRLIKETFTYRRINTRDIIGEPVKAHSTVIGSLTV